MTEPSPQPQVLFCLSKMHSAVGTDSVSASPDAGLALSFSIELWLQSQAVGLWPESLILCTCLSWSLGTQVSLGPVVPFALDDTAFRNQKLASIVSSFIVYHYMGPGLQLNLTEIHLPYFPRKFHSKPSLIKNNTKHFKVRISF